MQRPPAHRAALAVQLRCWLGCSAQLCASQVVVLRSVSVVMRSPRTAMRSPPRPQPQQSSTSTHSLSFQQLCSAASGSPARGNSEAEVVSVDLLLEPAQLAASSASAHAIDLKECIGRIYRREPVRR